MPPPPPQLPIVPHLMWFDQVFTGSDNLVYMRIVEKSTRYGKRQKRALVVLPDKLHLMGMDHKISRRVGMDSIKAMKRRRIPGKSEDESGMVWQILLVVPSEHDILIDFTADDRNETQDHRSAEYFIKTLNRLHRAHFPRSQHFDTVVPQTEDLYLQANFEKPEGYKPPKVYLTNKAKQQQRSKSTSGGTSAALSGGTPVSTLGGTPGSSRQGKPSFGVHSIGSNLDSLRDSPSASHLSSPKKTVRTAAFPDYDPQQPRQLSKEEMAYLEKYFDKVVKQKLQVWNATIEEENVQLKLKVGQLDTALEESKSECNRSAEKQREYKELLAQLTSEVEAAREEKDTLAAAMKRQHQQLQQQLQEEQQQHQQQQQQQTQPPSPSSNSPHSDRGTQPHHHFPLRSATPQDSTTHSAYASYTAQLHDPFTPPPARTRKGHILFSPTPQSTPPMSPPGAEVLLSGDLLQRVGSDTLRGTSLSRLDIAYSVGSPTTNAARCANLEPDASFAQSSVSGASVSRSASLHMRDSVASPAPLSALRSSSRRVSLESLPGLTAAEAEILATNASVRSAADLQYATMDDLLAVLSAPAARKLLAAVGYREGATSDATLVNCNVFAPPRLVVEGETVQSSANGGSGLMQENSNLRSMVEFLQGQINYLDAMKGVPTRGVRAVMSPGVMKKLGVDGFAPSVVESEGMDDEQS